MLINALSIILIIKLTTATPLRKTALLMNASGQMKQSFTLTTDAVVSSFLHREIGGEVEVEVSRVAKLRRDLLHWYWANRRLLPWRGDTIETSALPSLCRAAASDPLNNERRYETATDVEGKASSTITFVKSAYGTWISEIMLQQTRVETVIPYWLKWMDRFPDIIALANASGANAYTLLPRLVTLRILLQAFEWDNVCLFFTSK